MDSKVWLEHVENLLLHLIDRYGQDVINNWIISPHLYISPNDILDQSNTSVIYETIVLLRKLAPKIKLAFGDNSTNILQTMDYYTSNKILPDIWTMNLYHSILPEQDETNLKIMSMDEAFPLIVSPDENYVKHEIENIKHQLKSGNPEYIPIAVAEWNSNIWQRDLCNDTCYKSSYLFKNILENYDASAHLCYWSICDLNELLPSPDLFHGGFGLFTRNALPKAGYNALRLLNRMGNRLLNEGNGYFITRNEDEIQIFMYNYCEYDTTYRYRHSENVNQKERYGVFKEKNAVQYNISIEGLTPGKYKRTEYYIGRDGGSLFDEWLRIGAPMHLSAEESDVLLRLSHPTYTCEVMDVEETCQIKNVLNPHDIKLILISLRNHQ